MPVDRGPVPRVGNLALLVARPGRSIATSSGVVSALGGPGRTWRGGRLEGLRGVPDEVKDAARGMGLTPFQTLVRIDLPLATPAIVAGLRIATVSTISIATVAAFVLPEGLGYPIFTGIKQDEFKTEIIAAGGLTIILALSADAALVVAQRVLTPWRRA